MSPATQTFSATYKQDAGGASLQGEPFSTWADEVSVAGGLEYRKESVEGNSDPISQLRNPSYLTGGFQYGNPKPISGSYNVKEAFVETIVPLAAGAGLGEESLDLNAAVRRTDYSTSGQVTTWKAGLTYKPIESLMIRGTKSRDIRAANLNELYASSTMLAFGATDYGLIVNGVPSDIQRAAGRPPAIRICCRKKPIRRRSASAGSRAFSTGSARPSTTSTSRSQAASRRALRRRSSTAAMARAAVPLNTADCALINRDPTTGRITAVNTFPINDQRAEHRGRGLRDRICDRSARWRRWRQAEICACWPRSSCG